jgi:hypothetical protein
MQFTPLFGALLPQTFRFNQLWKRYKKSIDSKVSAVGLIADLEAYDTSAAKIMKTRISKVILFGERSLRRALSEYVEHFQQSGIIRGKGNVLLFPRGTRIHRAGPVQRRERLGGRGIG